MFSLIFCGMISFIYIVLHIILPLHVMTNCGSIIYVPLLLLQAFMNRQIPRKHQSTLKWSDHTFGESVDETRGCLENCYQMMWSLLLLLQSIMGVAYSMLACALWPLVALVVPEHQLGTAYGLWVMTAQCFWIILPVNLL